MTDPAPLTAEMQTTIYQRNAEIARLEAELECEKLDSHGLMERCKGLEAENATLRQRLADVNVKDAVKTNEINILTTEVRQLQQRLVDVEDDRCMWIDACQAEGLQVVNLRQRLAESERANRDTQEESNRLARELEDADAREEAAERWGWHRGMSSVGADGDSVETSDEAWADYRAERPR